MKRVDLKQRYKKETEEEMDYIFSTDSNKYLFITEDGVLVESRYFGDSINTFPSGKVWAFWTTNQSKADMIKDELFGEILEVVACEKGYSIDYNNDSINVCEEKGDDFQFTYDGKKFCESEDGKVIASSEEELKEYREEQQFYPEIVSLDDHGGVEYFSLD